MVASKGDSAPSIAFFLAYGVVTAGLIVYFRTPLEPGIWLTCLYYLLVALVAVLAYEHGRSRARDLPHASIRSALFFCVAIIAGALLSFLPIGFSLRLVVLVLVACGLLVNLRLTPHWKNPAVACAFVFGAFVAPFCFFMINAGGYATLFTPENILVGHTIGDTLYHSSIASMIGQFGVPSTGADGLTLVHYHTGSHILLGLLARGAEQIAPAGYYLGQQLLFFPLLFFVLIEATRVIAAKGTLSASALQPVVISIGIVMLMCLWGLKSFFVSESHALGLVFILVGAIYLTAFNEETDRLSATTLLTGCLILLLTASAKVSTGGVFGCAFAYALLMLRDRLSLYHYGLLALFGAALAWLVLSFFVPLNHVGQSRFDLFHFPRTFVDTAVVNLLLIGAAAALSLWQWARGRSPIWNQLVLVMLAVSTVPALLLYVPGGSAYYFMNIGAWIAIAALSAWLVEALSIRAVRLATVSVCVLALASTAANYKDGSYYLRVMKFADNLNKGYDVTNVTGSLTVRLAAVREATKNAPLKRLGENLSPYRTASPAALVLFSSAMWEAMPYSCTNAPLIVPSYVGLPMLLGLRTTVQPCKFNFYYSDYDRQVPPAPEALNSAEICAAAEARGFRRVLRVTTPDDVEKIDC